MGREFKWENIISTLILVKNIKLKALAHQIHTAKIVFN